MIDDDEIPMPDTSGRDISRMPKPDDDIGPGAGARAPSKGKDIAGAVGGLGKKISKQFEDEAQRNISEIGSRPQNETPRKVDVAPMQLPSYRKGVKSVPKTGPAVIHKGERILSAGDAKRFNRLSGKRMSSGRTGRR